MILVSMERRYPTLYYSTKQLYIGCVSFKITGGGNHPLLGRRVIKRLGKTRVNKYNLSTQQSADFNIMYHKFNYQFQPKIPDT